MTTEGAAREDAARRPGAAVDGSDGRGDDVVAPPPPPRGARILAQPWFWLLFVGLLFGIPLIKGLGAELPDPLPGLDRPPLEFTLPDETGREVSLADLGGYLVVATDLPLANGTERESTMDALRSLRRRLRGLGSAVVFVVLCHGGGPDDLASLLDEWTARKPVNAFLLDEGHEVMDELRHAAGSDSARWFLIDRHGRLRGAYGVSIPARPDDPRAEERRDVAHEEQLDRLVIHTGQLANWAASDPAPGDEPGG